ncbi:MAG: hypothetical protein E6J21_00585 [Chloroflexota bacterium]|nr:MAG: hypothetical protein E6J21_00585 [Chloroflexota bacterium]
MLDSLVDWANSLDKKLLLPLSLFSFPTQRFNILEIIAFTDDDCIPTPGWLSAGMAAFTGSVLGVSGRLIVPLEGVPTDYERNAAQLADSEFVTANCFYRRSCLEVIGGFDENFTSAWREDSDLIFALMRRFVDDGSGNQPREPGKIVEDTLSCPFVHAPDAIVIHPLRPAQWGISLRQQRKSMFNALLYKKHPRLYRQKIQATPPLHWGYSAGTSVLPLSLPACGCF